MARIKSIDNSSEPYGDDSPLTPFVTSTDEVSLKVGPSNVELFIEQEYKRAAEEQRRLYKAKGEREARPFDAVAARTRHDAEAAKKASADLDEKAAKAEARYDEAHADLNQFRRRPTDHKYTKWGRWLLLVGGDAAGLAGAAILLGESWLTAAPQAIAVGAAVVTLGAVGRDLRFLTAHRARLLQVKK